MFLFWKNLKKFKNVYTNLNGFVINLNIFLCKFVLALAHNNNSLHKIKQFCLTIEFDKFELFCNGFFYCF